MAIYTNSVLPSGGASSGFSGGIIQVRQTTSTALWSQTGYSPLDITGMSLSITPRSTSNKVLCYFSVWGTSNYYKTYINLLRGSTPLCQGAAAGSRPTQTSSWADSAGEMNSHGFVFHHSLLFLDSPNTTSATTYKLQGYGRAGYYMRVNYSVPDRNTGEYDSRYQSSFMLMEVSG
jgi:hypothetical protein